MTKGLRNTVPPVEGFTVPDIMQAHRDAVLAYLELSMFAASGYPDPLTDDQRAAYLTLPFLMDECKDTWDRLPVDSRPIHYLLAA